MKAFARFLYILSLAAFCVACGGGSGGDAITLTSAPPTADYTVLQLEPLSGDQRANAEDINDLGQIVGWSGGGTTGQTAVLWSVDQAGVVTIESLGKLPGGTTSIATAINNNAQVVGLADGATGTRRPFIWTESGGMRDLGVGVGLVGGQAIQINDNGQIVGAVFETELSDLTRQGRFAIWTVDEAGDVVDFRDLGKLGGVAVSPWDNNVSSNVAGNIWTANTQTGFFWSETGGVVEIDNTEEALGINDNDEVVGVRLSNGSGGYIWTAVGGLVEIPTGILMDANNAGRAAGRADLAVQQAFIWEGGAVEILPMPENRDFSWALSINEAGWVVGWSTDVNGNEYANLWTPN